jgi:uncharacterized protein (DUF58 family)
MLAQTAARPAGTDVDTEALLALRHVVAAHRRAGAERTAALPGPITTKRRGRGSEPDEIRPWTHGDDIRHIDRNTTARTGVPHVRTFRDEREQTTLLLADFRPSMLFGTRRAFRSVVAAEILALAGWRAVGLGARVALIAVGAFEPVFVRAANGDRAMTAVVGGLRRAHAAALAAGTAADPPLEDALSLAARSLPRGGSVVLATGLDTPGPAFDDTAAALRRRIDLLVALVGDAFPRTAPAGAYPFLTAAGVRGVHVGGRPAGDAAAESAAARLARLGARAVLFPGERPPEAQMLALGELHGDRR